MSTPTLKPRWAIFALAALTAELKTGGKLKRLSTSSWRKSGVVGAATGVPGARKGAGTEEGGAETALAATERVLWEGGEEEEEEGGVGIGVVEVGIEERIEGLIGGGGDDDGVASDVVVERAIDFRCGGPAALWQALFRTKLP